MLRTLTFLFISISAFSQSLRPVSGLNKSLQGVGEIAYNGIANYFPFWVSPGDSLAARSSLYKIDNDNICMNCTTTPFLGFQGGSTFTVFDSTGGNAFALEGTFGAYDYHWSLGMSSQAGKPYLGLWNGFGGPFMTFSDAQFGNPRVNIGGSTNFANAGVVEIYEGDDDNATLPLRISSSGNSGLTFSKDTSNCNSCNWSFGVNSNDNYKFSINNRLHSLTNSQALYIDTSAKVVINKRLQIETPLPLSLINGNDVLPKIKTDSLYWSKSGNISTGSMLLGSTDNSNVNISSGTGILALNNTTLGSVQIGTSSGVQSFSIGTGGNTKTVNIGGQLSGSATNLFSGSGNLNLNNSNNSDVYICSGATTNLINIGNNASGVKTINIGGTNGASVTNITSGTGGLNLSSNTANNTINIGNNAIGNKIINIGGTSGTSTLTLQAATGNIKMTGLQSVTGATESDANTNANTTPVGNLYMWTKGGGAYLMIKI